MTPRQNIIPCNSAFRHSGAACPIRDGAVHVWTLRLDLDRATQDRLEEKLAPHFEAEAAGVHPAGERTP